MFRFICLHSPSFRNKWLRVHKQAETTTRELAAFALICLWCHLFPLSHLWLADWHSICSVSWLVLLAQGGGLSEALWIMAGCPDNPCNVDSLSESNMAVLWQCSLKWGAWWFQEDSVHYNPLFTLEGRLWDVFNKLQSYFMRDSRIKWSLDIIWIEE